MSGESTALRGPAVLIVDDSGYARIRARRFLAFLGVERIFEAADGAEALRVFDAERPDLVVLDQVMRGVEGLEVARTLRGSDPSARVVMLTVLSDPDLPERAREAGVEAVIEKDRLDKLEFFIEGTRRA